MTGEERLINWLQTATDSKKKLAEKVSEYEYNYFDDMLFKPDSIVGALFVCYYQDDAGKLHKTYDDPPFSTSLFPSYNFKISKIRNAAGRCHPKKHIIVIHPDFETDETVIMHEMIHAYEGLLLEDPRGHILRDILFVNLYKSLKSRIKNLDELIMNHSHIFRQKDIAEKGGFHGILFFLKSLDLDLKLGLKPGTVCGYGRAYFDTGEEI